MKITGELNSFGKNMENRADSYKFAGKLRHLAYSLILFTPDSTRAANSDMVSRIIFQRWQLELIERIIRAAAHAKPAEN